MNISISEAILPPIQNGIRQISNHSRFLVLLILSVIPIKGVHIWFKYIRVARDLAHLPRISLWRTLVNGYRYNAKFIQVSDYSMGLIIKDSIRRGYTTDPTQTPDLWLTWILDQRAVVVHNPLDIQTILADHEKFEKLGSLNVAREAVAKDAVAVAFGENIITARTETWKRHRKVIYPAFRRGWSTLDFGTETRTLIAQLDKCDGEPVDVGVWMQRVTLDALSKTVFGFTMDSLRDAHSAPVSMYNDAFLDRNHVIVQMFPGPCSYLRRFTGGTRLREQQIARFNAYVNDLIDSKIKLARKQRTFSGDLMDVMVDAFLKDETEFCREDVRANTMLFFTAGHDTTATALTFNIYLMGIYPEIQEKARAEVLRIMGDVQADAHEVPIPTDNQESSMQYLTCVIKESLRLYPTASRIFSRVGMEDHVFADGTKLAKGTPVLVDIWNLHRSERVWGESAKQFVPERWLDNTSMNAGGNDYKWMAFGGGSRVCMGQKYSITDQRVTLCMLLLRYSWTVVGNDTAVLGVPDVTSGVVVHPKDIYVQLTRRN